jgi:hypothetical protein
MPRPAWPARGLPRLTWPYRGRQYVVHPPDDEFSCRFYIVVEGRKRYIETLARQSPSKAGLAPARQPSGTAGFRLPASCLRKAERPDSGGRRAPWARGGTGAPKI